jgi:hypothetical protein
MPTQVSDEPEILKLLEEIRRKAQIVKHAHFVAATRKQKWRDYLSVPVVLINLFLASAFAVLVSKELPEGWKWGAAVLGLVGAMLNGLQAHYNLRKVHELHRSIANRYRSVEQRCQGAIARFRDGIYDLKKIDERHQKLEDEYNKISNDADQAPITSVDHAIAVKTADDDDKILRRPSAKIAIIGAAAHSAD